MDVFKRGVLELALKQINEHTDITATWTTQKDVWLQGSHSSLSKKKPKQAEIATETPKTATNDLDTIKPLTEPQIAKYSMILCKLGSISDLSNFPDYPAFANWIGNILRNPEKADEQIAKRIFTALKTETDYSKKKLIFSCDGFSERAHSHWVNGCVLLCKNCLSRGNRGIFLCILF